MFAESQGACNTADSRYIPCRFLTKIVSGSIKGKKLRRSLMAGVAGMENIEKSLSLRILIIRASRFSSAIIIQINL